MAMMNRDDTMAARAGRYVQQPPGYPAFILKPLSPDPPISMNEELLTLLSEANFALGGLQKAEKERAEADQGLPEVLRQIPTT